MKLEKKKVLIVSAHRPNRSPSQRFRYEQYIPFLEEHGYVFTYSYLISEKDDQFFYKKGYLIQKVGVLVKSVMIRFRDVLRANKFDIVFIQREAFMLGTSFFERLFSRKNPPIVFDFDDAIWFSNAEGGNKTLSFLKNPDKLKRIISLSDVVIAGNRYLYDYAKQFCEKTEIIPTTIDLSYHQLKEKKGTDICIGWTGSFSTLPYFESLLPVLSKLKNEYSNLKFKVIVDVDRYYSEIMTQTTKWEKDSEIDELNSISIGIMPIPNDEWAKGKCGFKGLQYMALKKACVMSAVGVNNEIIDSGKNGFLVKTDDQWYEKLKILIEDEELRLIIGENGYQTMKNRYSVEANKIKYLTLFDSILGCKK